MANVVVIGGGFAGMAAAARLAKLGHDVTVFERTESLGGTLRPVRQDGFHWDSGPVTVALPAPLRDLFRKSGRPMERVLDLQPVESPRRHIHPNGTIDLPLTGRGAQAEAIAAVTGAGAADAWTRLVDSYEPVWECLRTRALETPFRGRTSLRRSDLAVLRPRRKLTTTAKRGLPDPLTRALLTHYATVDGSVPRRTPGFAGVVAYVERTFGRWSLPGGMSTLVDALGTRLTERKVAVRTNAPVVSVRTDAGRVTGIELADGEQVRADVVVSAIDARVLYDDLLDHPPGTSKRRIRPAQAPRVVHLGLRDPLPELPHEVVLHPSEDTRATLVLRAPADPGLAPPGHAAWSLLVYGRLAADPLDELARRGIDVRERVVTHTESVATGFGVAWNGARTACDRALNDTPVEGLFCVGATAHPGAGLPLIALGVATVAELVGKVERVPRR